MKAYEGVFIFPPEATPEARKDQFKNLDDLIAKLKGSIVQKNDWGKKPVGYPIRKFQEGHFLIVDFQMVSTQMPEFVKALELQEDILKFMITIKEEARPNPKAAKSAEAKSASAPAVGAAPRSATAPVTKTTVS